MIARNPACSTDMDLQTGGGVYAEKTLSRPGVAPNRCHKLVVSLDWLLFSFEMLKLWNAAEERPPFETTRYGEMCTTGTSKYQIAHATSEALVAPFVSASLRY